MDIDNALFVSAAMVASDPHAFTTRESDETHACRVVPAMLGAPSAGESRAASYLATFVRSFDQRARR